MKGIGGMGGGMKGIGGMGGGMKGIGGMGGGMKGVGGMGGGFRGVGSAGGGWNYGSYGDTGRYGEYSRRYGENNTRYGGTEEMNESTRYGVTTGRYGMPVNSSGDENLSARYNRIQQYSGLMNQVSNQRNMYPAESGMMNRMRQLEQSPPTSFNHIYVP